MSDTLSSFAQWADGTLTAPACGGSPLSQRERESASASLVVSGRFLQSSAWRVARVISVCLLMALTPPLSAESLTILLPNTSGVESFVTFRNEQSTEITVGPFSAMSGQTSVELPLSKHDRTCAIRAEHKETGRISLATVDFGTATNLTCRLEDTSFFRPYAVRLGLVTKDEAPTPTVRVELTDSAGHVRTATLGAVDRFEVVEFSDLHHGHAAVSVSVGARKAPKKDIYITEGRQTQYVPLLIDGEFAEAEQGRAGVLGLPTNGQPDRVVFFGVSVLLFVITLIVWAGGASVVALLPSAFEAAEASRMHRAILLSMLICGVVLLGNGVALLIVGDAAYLAVVTGIAAVQLVALSWLILAVRGRNRALISAGTFVAVTSFIASVVFLPALAIERGSPRLGIQLSIAQLILVTAAIGLLVAARLRDWIGEEARARAQAAQLSRPKACQVCGKQVHPLTGTCGCSVTTGNPEERKVARLVVKSARGAMTQFLLGPTTTIGADSKCDLRLDLDPHVAHNHCVIFERGRDIVIRDISGFGTYVNGERVSERGLRDGDEIRLGDSWLLFEKM